LAIRDALALCKTVRSVFTTDFTLVFTVWLRELMHEMTGSWLADGYVLFAQDLPCEAMPHVLGSLYRML
jgi:hypothetical protein